MSAGRRWGPVARGGRGRRWPRRLGLAVLALLVAATTGTLSSAVFVVRAVEEQRRTIAVDELEEREEPEEREPDEPPEPLNILLVGSDGRQGLTDQEQSDLVLGEFDDKRADTNIVVSISADRSVINMVSIPRDLVVDDPMGGVSKVSETLITDEDTLVQAVRDQLGFPVNHYVEVSISGFLETVRAVGGVELCLDEPLFDPKSGADFEAGCNDFTDDEALAYVRSRRGALGDFERIERQQTFLRALAGEITDASLLLRPDRLRAVGDQVVENVVTDDGLGVDVALQLAGDLQPLLTGDLPMITVPAYPRRLRDDQDGVVAEYVVAYRPGLDQIVDDLQAGRELAARGTPEQREQTEVLLWHGSRFAASQIVSSTLLFGGFTPVGSVAGELDAATETVVYATPETAEQAGWVAAHLGAPVEDLPPELDTGGQTQVIVAIGEDASPPEDLAALAVPAP